MQKPIFTGAGTALITPFKDGEVDYKALEGLIEFQIAGGIDALIICGTTGEPATLDDNEHKRVVEFALEKVNGRVPVIAGTGSNNTQYAVDLSRFAEKAGADGLLLVTPYYNKCSQKGIVSHFNTVADSVNIPCIVYNVPGRTGFCISVDSYKQIAKHQNIVATKEASGNLLLMMEVLEACGNDMYMYSGDDQQVVPLMSMGAIGFISVFSNIMPAEAHKMAQACLDGDFKTAAAMQLKYLRLMNGLFMQVNPIPVKTAVAKMGYCNNEFRMPLCPMDAADDEKLFALMREQGLIK
ncbi:MAG: 4-hydroxy-tetrahydrodipicolinate synthase [Ruminococcaceae bacterium]|nr:4-hydroxy-tetrahydrodipicolinate synthase [Oscillospiraceae bacterium]